MTITPFRLSSPVTKDQIAEEWDRLAQLRCEQIESGKDLSFANVLLPMVMRLSQDLDHSNVLDVGCGVGFVTREIARRSQNVVGIDISKASIEHARKRTGSIRNVQFFHSSVEQFSVGQEQKSFTCAVSNMMLMTAPHLVEVIRAVSSLVRESGHFIFTICHPCFWPKYWGYDSEIWFSYDREIAIKSPFRISLDTSSQLVSTHIHRPLHQYVTALEAANFVIEKIMEPMPDADVQSKYDKRWEFPRFVGVRCCKRLNSS